MRLTVDIYQLTAQLPTTERLGLSTSLQQAAVSMPSLLASGSKSGRRGFQEALIDARRAAAEVETLLIIVQQTYPSIPVDDLLTEIADLQTSLSIVAKRLSNPRTPKSV